MPEPPQAWSLSDVRAVVSGVHYGRHDRTGFRRHRLPCRIRPDTVHSTPGMPWRTGRDADRERTNGTEGVRTSSIATTTRQPARTRRAPSMTTAFAARQPRLARRWQDCQRNRNHGSDQAAAWCRSNVQAAPRRTAVLGRLRVESRASGGASSVMASTVRRLLLVVSGRPRGRASREGVRRLDQLGGGHEPRCRSVEVAVRPSSPLQARPLVPADRGRLGGRGRAALG
jgi:hypothetical protein